MNVERPDLSQVNPEILAYIEYLEGELERSNASTDDQKRDGVPEPSEPPTTLNLITATRDGVIKRTPRHNYGCQRRGGMGIFDIDATENDPPGLLTIADQADTLLILTTQARIYHLAIDQIQESPIRSRGVSLRDHLPIPKDERIAFIGPMKSEGYLALLSERGYVRVLRHNYLAPSIRQASQVLDVARFGDLIAASWVKADDDIFLATQQGLAIRFSAKRIHPAGSLGIRLEKDDSPVAIAGVTEESGVFMLGQDGKGTIRMMSGFRENKTLGSGGKVAIKTDNLVCAFAVSDSNDIFIISKLSKLIRFQAEEIPPKEGVVQGVNCMSLRADICVAAAASEMQTKG